MDLTDIRIETGLTDELLGVIAHYAETLPANARDRVEREFATFPSAYLAKQGGALLTARRHERAVGCVALRRDDDHSAMLKRLFVEPSERGSGVARRLIEAATERAHLLGYDALVATTFPDMAEAQAFYQALGFDRDPAPRHEGVGELIVYRRPVAAERRHA